MSSRIFLIAMVVVCFVVPKQLYSQDVQFVNLNKIPQKKVRIYFENRYGQEQAVKPDELQASCLKNEVPMGYNKHVKSYIIKQSKTLVWENYSKMNPTDVWNGKRVSLGCLFNKKSQQITYSDERAKGINTGQVYFLNLRLVKGMCNVATAFELINIDEDQRMIEFSYLKGNKSEGKQQIILEDTDKGYTRITHVTYFKSDSKIRDKLLYPFFHTRAIKEFHRNVQNAAQVARL